MYINRQNNPAFIPIHIYIEFIHLKKRMLLRLRQILSGQSRVPEPPQRMTGMMLVMLSQPHHCSEY